MKLFYGQIFPTLEFHIDEIQHITKVLRIKEGTEIHITDGKGNLASGKLVINGKKITLEDICHYPIAKPFSHKIHIAIAPTKNIDRTEFFLEKAIEMGVDEITFLLTDNSERKNINIEKLNKQAITACKQSLRTNFPTINNITKLTDFLSTCSENTFVAHCNEQFKRVSITEYMFSEKNTFLIGPEGDFSKREIELLTEKGIVAVNLGSQRLRTETAGIFLAAWNYSKMI